jgi:hypothetical protein
MPVVIDMQNHIPSINPFLYSCIKTLIPKIANRLARLEIREYILYIYDIPIEANIPRRKSNTNSS